MRVLHMFNYKLNDINVEEVAKQGFTHIQISPMQGMKQEEFIWWCAYQPLGFKIIDNYFGTKQDLIDLCDRAKKVGIKVVLDVVLNHVANDPYNHLLPHKLVDKKLIKANIWKENKMVEDYEDRWQVTHWCIGMPSIDTSIKEAQKMIIDFLLECVSYGVSGFRLDALKHMATVSEGNDFLIELNKQLPKEVMENSYGEVIFSSKEILDEYAKYINVLTEGHTTDKNRTVAFIDSHDLYYEFKITQNMSHQTLINEYNILTKNFNNTLFFARPFDNLWKSEEIRKINLGSGDK